MTDRLSSNGPRGQHPRRSKPLEISPELVGGILPFDLHAENVHGETAGCIESPDTIPLPGGPRGDDDFDDDDFDDEFDHDEDTPLVGTDGNEDDGHDGDDEPPPASSGAMGLPCHSDRSAAPKSPPYTLCAVSLRDDDPDEVLDGQDLVGLQTKSMALACCDGFSLRRDMLATRFKIDPTPYTHLVVNDHTGREVHRRPILAAA